MNRAVPILAVKTFTLANGSATIFAGNLFTTTAGWAFYLAGSGVVIPASQVLGSGTWRPMAGGLAGRKLHRIFVEKASGSWPGNPGTTDLEVYLNDNAAFNLHFWSEITGITPATASRQWLSSRPGGAGFDGVGSGDGVALDVITTDVSLTATFNPGNTSGAGIDFNIGLLLG